VVLRAASVLGGWSGGEDSGDCGVAEEQHEPEAQDDLRHEHRLGLLVRPALGVGELTVAQARGLRAERGLRLCAAGVDQPQPGGDLDQVGQLELVAEQPEGLSSRTRRNTSI
jgi:hypothetical protein